MLIAKKKGADGVPIDDRKQRILMAIVSLYSNDAEPVGSSLLSQYLNMSVSSATLRNEMAALTKLGLLDQPHTSAGRIPTAKGYRYYVDSLLQLPASLSVADKTKIDRIFSNFDYDPEKLAQGAAKELSSFLGYTVVASTPKAEDIRIAHFEIFQVGLYTAAILAVTNAGGVITRIAKTEFELNEQNISEISNVINKALRFIAAADVNSLSIHQILSSFGENGQAYWPIVSAAFSILQDAGTPKSFLAGEQFLLQWQELEPSLKNLIELFNDTERLQKVIVPQSIGTAVLFGEELCPVIPGLCVVSRRYVAGGGLKGTLAVAGPARMEFNEVIPVLEYFGEQLEKHMIGIGS